MPREEVNPSPESDPNPNLEARGELSWEMLTERGEWLAGMERALAQSHPDEHIVELAMRYPRGTAIAMSSLTWGNVQRTLAQVMLVNSELRLPSLGASLGANAAVMRLAGVPIYIKEWLAEGKVLIAPEDVMKLMGGKWDE